MRTPPRTRRHPERDIQATIVQLLRTVGAQVYTLGTTRRRGDWQGTMMSPGLPDILAFLPDHRAAGVMTLSRALVVEVKAPDRKIRPESEQAVFRDCCLTAGIDHIVGGLDEVIQWLIEQGYLKRENVAHYRLQERA